MTTHIKENGIIKPVTKIYCRDNNIWKSVDKMFVKQNNVWLQTYSKSPNVNTGPEP